MTNKELADLIYPNLNKTLEDYENIFKERELPQGAIVTRFAPSPTGFVHMGSLLTAFIAKKVTEDTNGVFILRIEDTDQKRSVENGIDGIIEDLTNFEIKIDEGVISEDKQIGDYGPYIQTQRKEIYDAAAKWLIENDYAYPCFSSEEELESIRNEQESKKERIGYYGVYAKYRDISNEEKAQLIKNGVPYVIRLKSRGDFNKKTSFIDAVRGKIEFPENDIDSVLIKSDGIPVYHFAHVIDDHFMRVTHVLRGEEWISSTPLHLELFKLFGFDLPTFCHLGVVMKVDESGTRRKLSKRKDPEAAVSYYHEKGYPIDAVKLYLITIANSNFEMWYTQNPGSSLKDFKFDFKRVSDSGTLFDLEKLNNISKVYISSLKAIDLYEQTLKYTNIYDNYFYELLKKYKEYTINVLNIEREIKRPRKDIACYSDVKYQISYMYDELFSGLDYKNLEIKDFYDTNILEDYFKNVYNKSDEKEVWFNKIKEFCPKYNFSPDTKAYKDNPSAFVGHVGDLCELIRVMITGRIMTPDLYEILKLLNADTINKRIELFKNYINK